MFLISSHSLRQSCIFILCHGIELVEIKVFRSYIKLVKLYKNLDKRCYKTLHINKVVTVLCTMCSTLLPI